MARRNTLLVFDKSARVQDKDAGTTGLRDAILEYVHRNPSAADTLRGVMNCWLPAHFIGTEAKAVELAMEQLVAKGILRKSVLADGSVLYAGTAGRRRRLTRRKNR
ncbi:MAG: hypothetical protein OEP48_16440 [Betaproteobacteria bacterium]|nr:hypothetical protein [Betaproteobacteria bacterium]MDH3437942.1 hypothetical protein [Betaproteobacteria bacterium]